MSKRAEEIAEQYYPKSQYPGSIGIGLRYACKVGYEEAVWDLGWISVEERLPETADYVFTCIEMAGKPQCVGIHYFKDGKWWGGYEEDGVGAVEYWMQIPRFKEERK